MEGPATSSGALPPDTNDTDDLTMEPSDDLGLGPEVPGGTEHPLEHDYDVSNDAQLLRQAWINESLTPEVLMYREDLVDRIRSLIARQEKIVEDYEQDHNQALTRAIRFAEVSRIKFCLRSYLRKRLSKIEAYAIHIYMNEELSSKLSPQELEFAKDYIDAVNRLFKDSILSRLPKDYNDLLHQSMESEAPDMIPEPSLDRHVFVRVLDDLGDIPIDDQNTTFRLQEGDIFAIRYRLIRDFVDSGRVELV
ncbi:subunit Sld5 of DNA replication complex GINS complex [Chloropicon roscoffensis]|uniref:DNA replication complex GINS protein SLD5 n=1 Tax=Chloropicon roscoffensis TaxID=1461544 RepID=A0AAX4PIP3_9CHLO